MTIRKIIQALHAADILAIVFDLAMSGLILYHADTIEDWPLLIALNLSVCLGILILASVTHWSPKPWMHVLHDWYLVPLVFLSFKEMHVYIQAMDVKDYDDILIAIDRWMFGVDPTVWLYHFAAPVVTEVLQIAYSSFYFLMITLGVELYLRREKVRFSFAVFSITYGFFLSYVGYLLVPGVGPRFTLHDFHSIDTELPGLWVSEWLRDMINAGESIPKTVANAMELAQRDVFPSGHTEMTLITIALMHRYKLSSRHVVTFLGVLLIIGTVYLRYHYVVDLIAGAILAAFVVWTGRYIFAWWERVRGNSLPEI